MELERKRYYIAVAALAVITAAHAFSSSLKNAARRESSSLHNSCGFKRRSRKQFASSTFAASKKWEDVLSFNQSKRLDGGENISIFENMFGIQFPWENNNHDNYATSTQSHQQQRRQSTWQWQWPSSGSSTPPSSATTNKLKSTTLTTSNTNRLHVESLPPQPQDYISTNSTSEISLDDNYLPTKAIINSGREKAVQLRTNEQSLHQSNNTFRQPKLGILLIDHGSKRMASNEHLHSIAQSYQTIWDSAIARTNAEASSGDISTFKVTVRAAHMEIAAPSIDTQLRQLITQDKVTHAICVPYFLSPGKHATVDVPNLIDEARDRLEEEGYLEYEDRSGGGGSKRMLVEIHTTKSVGTNIESMLNVVDDLVRIALNKSDVGSTFQFDADNPGHRASKGNHEQSSGNHTPSANNITTTNELQKYANRAALLENVLQVNTKQLRTVTNRALLMETALKQLQIKRKKEMKESCELNENQEKFFVEQVANLTAVIDAITREKDMMMQSLESQRFELEREYNATIGNLEAKVISMDQDLMRIGDENKRAELRAEERQSHLTEELDEKCRQQQERIQELQIQLADLLDAYAQLEQLQNDTERAFLDENEKLKELNVTYESSIKMEHEEKEKFRIKWMDAQRQIEQDGELLNETSSKYEVQLEEERGKVREWKAKWEAMKVEQSSPANVESSRNYTFIQQIDPAETEQKLYEAAKFKADAIDRIQTLEAELIRQKAQYESMSAQKEEEEQQQQLQKYLRAQLSTYYETIQSQKSQISIYEEEIADMRQRHNESTLIATSSVEASQCREANLLTSVEELESELLIAEKERDSRQDELNVLQARIHKMESLESHCATLEKRNEELTLKIELLERKVIEKAQQNDEALAENISVVLERRDQFEKYDINKSSSQNPQHQRFGWVRAIFRPFALLRGKR